MLLEKLPNLRIKVQIIKTLGDRLDKQPIHTIKDKGVFEKEIDKAVIDGEIDFAIHSMKDVPVIRPIKTQISAVPARGPPFDVLLSKNGLKLKDLPKKSIIGTGSVRRIAQLRHCRSDLDIKPIRGNVDTRIKKLEKGEYDAIILAEAGIVRLGLEQKISERLSIEDFIPAPGQGALCLMTRKDDRAVDEILKKINHQPSMLSQITERSFLKEIGASCSLPLGAHAQIEDNQIILNACIYSLDGKVKAHSFQKGDISNPKNIGVNAAKEIIKKGKNIITKEID
jgi:hydroxymethylbilane synthase